MDEIDEKDIKLVNTFSRLDLVKQKTNEMNSKLCREADPRDPEIHAMCEKFDYLAIDWVYSNEPAWEGSAADLQSKKIYASLSPCCKKGA